MAPQTGTALLILGIFVLPGFVTLLIRERTYTVPGEQTSFERLLTALYYSALVYGLTITAAVLGGLGKRDIIELYHGRKPLSAIVATALLVVVVAPVFLSEVGRRWRRSGLRTTVLRTLRISEAHSVVSAWNQAFSGLETAYIRVTTRDGRVLGGLYRPRDPDRAASLAGYSEQAQDLYISERWTLDGDGWFIEAVRGSLGFWVPRDNIASFELYAVGTSDDAH